EGGEEQKDIFNVLPMSFGQEVEKRVKKTISLSSESIIFENYTLVNEDIQIVIENCREVKFVNCEFDRLRVTPLVISSCNSVMFENCTFKNISSEVLVLVECTDLAIKNCEFDFITVPNIIRFNTIDNFLIENSLFVKISFKQLSEAIISVTEWPDNFIIRSNTFINCKNTSGFGSLLLYSNAKLNDNANILIDRNEFVNCFASVVLNCQYLEPKHYSSNKIDNNTKLR
ncbi:MAG: right-handed parallel beta-helix repeat-containing protein, partial [Clostridiales bacterium]|nr:right-handed parallel beta-helix repeat-containing protein [Clostridiales bacterium]